MKLVFFLFIFSIILAYKDAICGEYDMPEDMCIHFACTSGVDGTCLSLPTDYIPNYFTSFRASVRFLSDYTFKLRVKIFAYYHCQMPIFDIDVFTHKPLLRNSTVYEGGTYVDNVFSYVDMTPLIDDIEYNLDLDCKQPIPANQTIHVSSLNAEDQMCMYELSGAPVDLFGIIQQLASYSIPIDVQWMDDKTMQITSEDLSLVSSVLPFTSLNMTRITDTTCRRLEND